MPYDRSLYPPDWPAISLRIRERAGWVCEWPGCAAPNGELVVRDRRDRERWRLFNASTDADDCDGSIVRVVLTVAHLDDPTPTNVADKNLAALCQLHHLRLDSALHARHAAETRRRRRVAAGR